MKKLIFILLIIIKTGIIISQDSIPHQSQNQFKIDPIVQIFGTAIYNISDNHYAYRFARAHLGFKYRFNEKWSSKIIIDRGNPTTISDISISNTSGDPLQLKDYVNEGSAYTMFLKFASLKFSPNDQFSIEGGAILQNHYITQERFWALRYISQTFQDLYWKIPSSDLGFLARYRINNTFSLDAAISNGEGPRLKQDEFGKVKMAIGLDFNPSARIQSRIYYHTRQSGFESLTTEHMFSFFTGLKTTKDLRFGGEFNYMQNLNNNDGLDSYGLSIYAIYKLLGKAEIFARFDKLFYINPDNVSMNIYGSGNTVIAGISHSPVNGINLSVNYQGWIPESSDDSNINYMLLSMELKF